MLQLQAACRNHDFFTIQSRVIERSIAEHKWYLSEKAGKDVGWEAASQSFFNTYFAGFAAGFRVSYCTLVCPNRQECGEAQKWLINFN